MANTYSTPLRQGIFQGLTATQLGEVFRMKRQNVERRLSGVEPCGVSRQGTPLYQIADAAPKLVRIELTEELVIETLQHADPKDFPALTNKIFWDSLIVRRKYEHQIGDLWHTDEVIAVASACFQSIRMSLLLLPDELTDSAGLNERQRAIVQGVIDNSMEATREALVEELSRPGPESSATEDEI